MGPVLRELRPDLTVDFLDAQPTGLVVCRNLAPTSTVLCDNTRTLIDRWSGVTLEQYGVRRLFEEIHVQSSREWLASVKPIPAGPHGHR